MFSQRLPVVTVAFGRRREAAGSARLSSARRRDAVRRPKLLLVLGGRAEGVLKSRIIAGDVLRKPVGIWDQLVDEWGLH
ncbi:hypothetical protein BDA96_06G081200 [Sorghum bicolor]|uniref:Uncharacterized protein n=1 Tax=Sorghum bicolor TaxID=4558 RepID=A0A921QPX1_SORBI|nr:hypothetical protein BDA96_06G081200 [Sorghum bicolor]